MRQALRAVSRRIASASASRVRALWPTTATGAAHPSVNLSRGACYLDLCTGSADTILEHVNSFTAHAAKSCVLGFTTHQRDFAGSPLAMRLMRLVQHMQELGWKPAAHGLERSTYLHKSSHGLDVITQFWVGS